ncbi:MAG: hypothetical protein DRQ51_07200 [Gammaproteobacteria bacterium]|nr:MAG: hypothetical protein DRQ51_07200 [Gammaproteobacteria bacterium]
MNAKPTNKKYPKWQEKIFNWIQQHNLFIGYPDIKLKNINEVASITEIVHSVYTDVAITKVSYVPDEIMLLPNLFHIDLELDKNCKNIEVISKLIKLEELSLKNSNLTQLPINFKNIKNLTSLDLANNNLDEFCLDIINQINICRLNLSHNNLKKWHLIPDSNYSQIRLDNNPLTKITTDYYDEKMEELDLSNCQLKNLPQNIHNLSNLQVLHVEGNQIDVLSAGFAKLDKLKFLQIDQSPLKDIITLSKNPHYFSNLKSITFNNITKIDKQINKLQQVVSVTVYNDKKS